MDQIKKFQSDQHWHFCETEARALASNLMAVLLDGENPVPTQHEKFIFVECKGGLLSVDIKPDPKDFPILIGANNATGHASQMLFTQLAGRLGVKLHFQIHGRKGNGIKRCKPPVQYKEVWPVEVVALYADQICDLLFQDCLVELEHEDRASYIDVFLGADPVIPCSALQAALFRVFVIWGKSIGHDLLVRGVTVEG